MAYSGKVSTITLRRIRLSHVGDFHTVLLAAESDLEIILATLGGFCSTISNPVSVALLLRTPLVSALRSSLYPSHPAAGCGSAPTQILHFREKAIWCSESAPCSLDTRQRPTMTCDLPLDYDTILTGLNISRDSIAYGATLHAIATTTTKRGMCDESLAFAAHGPMRRRNPIPAVAVGFQQWLERKTSGGWLVSMYLAACFLLAY
jgi:hypothetical protein